MASLLLIHGSIKLCYFVFFFLGVNSKCLFVSCGEDKFLLPFLLRSDSWRKACWYLMCWYIPWYMWYCLLLSSLMTLIINQNSDENALEVKPEVNHQCKAMPQSWLCVVKTASCNLSIQNDFNAQLLACFYVYNGGRQKHTPYFLLLHTHMHTWFWQLLIYSWAIHEWAILGDFELFSRLVNFFNVSICQ